MKFVTLTFGHPVLFMEHDGPSRSDGKAPTGVFREGRLLSESLVSL